MRLRLCHTLLGAVALLGAGCEVEPLSEFTAVPAFEGSIALVKDKPISGEAVLVSLLVNPPDPALNVTEVAIPGGNEEPRFPDIHISLKANYSAAGVLGSHAAGDFVPYLIVNARITNLDTSEILRVRLLPEVSFVDGYSYGHNIALVEALGISELGYAVAVSISPPALVGDPDGTAEGANGLAISNGASPLSPGISVGPDLAPFLQGTVLTIHDIGNRQGDTTSISGAFTLSDFVAAEEEGTETGGTGTVPTYTY